MSVCVFLYLSLASHWGGQLTRKTTVLLYCCALNSRSINFVWSWCLQRMLFFSVQEMGASGKAGNLLPASAFSVSKTLLSFG